MENVEIVFFLLLSAVLLVGLSQKINVPYPIALILGGAVISFIPGINHIYFNPDLILMLCLPPILYYGAFGISFREFQRDWKNIFSLALGLVALTTCVVAVVFKWIFPQFSWALAFTFGAIVSPPDAVAVTSILKRFNIHSRLMTLLEGESLINDASAILIYKISLLALLTGPVSIIEGVSTFLYIVCGGVVVGLALGFLFQEFSRRYLEPVLGVVFSFIIPYATYIIASLLGVSGVLAVVVNGLLGARILHTHSSSLRRILGYAVWDIIIILLNCFVFIMIGLQVRSISKEFSFHQIAIYFGYAFLIAIVMIIVRMMWVYGRAAYFYFKALHRPNSFEICPEILKEAAIVGWAGMRGIVSLAVALSLPFALPGGMPLEGRNEIVFLTFSNILITLLLPGLTLPYLIRWLKLNPSKKNHEDKKIRDLLVIHAEEKIDIFLDAKTITQNEHAFLKNYFRLQHKAFEFSHEQNFSHIENIRRKIIFFQRSKLNELWREHTIDDKLFNHFEGELDLLEIHTARGKL